LTDGGAEEIGSLIGAGNHQQPAVGASLDGELLSASVFLRNEIFCGTLEVVEHVLLVEQPSSIVPLLSVLTEREKNSPQSMKKCAFFSPEEHDLSCSAQ